MYSSEVFGSEALGTTVASSDIDIRIFLSDAQKDQNGIEVRPPEEARQKLEQFLKDLPTALAVRKHGDFVDVEFLRSRHPLVSLRIAASGQVVQIVAAKDPTYVRRVIYGCLRQYPDALPIFVIMRQALEMRGLNNVFRGGINSYTLFHMVVASLKLKPGNRLAENFLNFLKFYVDFDSWKYGLSQQRDRSVAVQMKTPPPPEGTKRVSQINPEELSNLSEKERVSLSSFKPPQIGKSSHQ
jgi:hypothetical protein